MDSMKVNVEKMEAQVKEWGKKTEELAVKADDTGAQVKAGYHKHLDNPKAKRIAAQSKFEEFKGAGIENWAVFKLGVEIAWNDLENAFKSLNA